MTSTPTMTEATTTALERTTSSATVDGWAPVKW
uniref:Uncharacterized protein n=1 Tax=Arundo donax TaxID=35708 RepID=A0A0A9BUY3_ARUDO